MVHEPRPHRILPVDQLPSGSRIPPLRKPLLDARIAKLDVRRHSDITHKFLGRALAQVLALGESFREGEAMGWGPGRATHYVIDEFFRSKPQFNVRVSLYSMAGRAGAKTHAEGDGRFDSDINIEAVAKYFSPDPDRHHLVHSIWSGGRRETTWMGRNEQIDLGIVGVGVLGPGHAFVEEVDEQTEELKRLIEICKKAAQDFPAAAKIWVPCADVCNRLLPVEPPPGVDFRQAREVEDLIEEINASTLTVGPKELDGLPLTVVAGTLAKAAAIKSVLVLDTYNVQALCTSRPVARWLVEAYNRTFKPLDEFDDS